MPPGFIPTELIEAQRYPRNNLHFTAKFFSFLLVLQGLPIPGGLRPPNDGLRNHDAFNVNNRFDHGGKTIDTDLPTFETDDVL